MIDKEFLLLPVRRPETSFASSVTREIKLLNTHDETGTLIYCGFEVGREKLLLSEFAIFIEPKYIKDTNKFRPPARDSFSIFEKPNLYGSCVVLIAENSHAPVLSSMNSRFLCSNASAIVRSATTSTTDEIRENGNSYQKNPHVKELSFNHTLKLFSELTARVIEGKIKNIKGWRAQGLRIMNSIADRNGFGKDSRQILDFINKNREVFVEFGIAELLYRNRDKQVFTPELLTDINSLIGAQNPVIDNLVKIEHGRSKEKASSAPSL